MTLTVGQLEQALFDEFPRTDAESWDNPGLSVGDRSAHVTKVALNLDQSDRAVIAAAEAGCNVLVTHHPPFIKGGPTELGPAVETQATGPGRVLYEAASRGVAVIAMHTNADRAIATRKTYARMLGYELVGNFEHLINPARSARDTGYGALLEAGEGTTLEQVATNAQRAFGGSPRIWGARNRPIHRIAILNGSWSEPELYSACVSAGIECAIVGETRYHFCTDAAPHLSVIDLGHDVSEFPIVGVLAEAVAAAGVASEDIVELGLSANNWWSL